MKSRDFCISTGLIAVGFVFVASSAQANDDQRRRSEITDPYTPVTTEESDEHVHSGLGVSMSVGGGLMNFTDRQLNNQTDPGGNWQARLTLGTRSVVAIEGAYTGTANNVNGLGLDSDSMMTAHGAEGVFRLNLGLAEVQPYVFGGAAWKRYSLLYNNNLVSSVSDSDDVIETPIGAGIAFRGDGFVFDTRFDYRFAHDEEMFAPIVGQKVDMDNWNATARVGFEF